MAPIRALSFLAVGLMAAIVSAGCGDDGGDEAPAREIKRLASHGSLEGSGRVKLVQEFSMTLSDVNEDQEIDAPEDPAPFDELVEKLPLQLSGLGEFLSR